MVSIFVSTSSLTLMIPEGKKKVNTEIEVKEIIVVTEILTHV